MNKEKPRRLVKRLLAIFLALVMLLSVMANLAVAVSIRKGDETQAATNYLAQQTEYVNEDWLSRLSERLKALGKPESILDYYRLASIQIAEQDYDTANSNLTTCQNSLVYEDDPDFYLELLLKRACLLVLLDRPEEAIELLRTSTALDPNQAEVLLIEAQIFSEQGDLAATVEALGGYLQLEPFDDSVRAMLAQIYFTQQDYENAAHQYRQILSGAQADEANAPWFYQYGLTSMQLSDYSSAEKAFSQALQVNPLLEDVFYYRGVCRMGLQDYPGTIADMTESIRQGTDNQACRYTRGVARLMIENPDYTAALEDLRAAAGDAGEDADAATAQQAQELIEQIEPLLKQQQESGETE